MRRVKVALSAALVALSSMGLATSAEAATVNFGCSTGGRTIGATAYYSANGSTQWFVDRIAYSYSNSGGGKSNTDFAVYNGSNAVAWTWSTPDDRTNRSYSKNVDRVISRGRSARASQRTWFDVFGNDPSCSRAGSF